MGEACSLVVGRAVGCAREVGGTLGVVGCIVGEASVGVGVGVIFLVSWLGGSDAM